MISEETTLLLSQMIGKPIANEDARKIFLQLNSEDTFAPSALITSLLESIQVQFDDIVTSTSNTDHVFSDILARDKHTGFYIHPALRTLYLDFAIARASLPGQEKKNFLIMGDYFNLSSVNEAIGRSTTNDLMATICGIYLDSLTSCGVVDCLYHRSMGDEITMIAVNTSHHQIEKGLELASKRTKEFIRALGLERLRHKKYKNQKGAGMFTAFVALRGDSQHNMLKQQLDETIQTRKRINRMGLWASFGRNGVEPQQFHTRASEQRIDRVLHKYKNYRLNNDFNADIANVTSARNALNQATALLVGRAIAWPRDDRIEYLSYHHGDKKIMLRADIYNLGGLNAVYGHDGADHIKAHMIRILFSTVAAHQREEPRIFDCGGGIIDVVMDELSSQEMIQMVRAIQINIYHQILSLSIAGYANAYNLSFAGEGNILLSKLPHPRGDYAGTGLVMAVHAVSQDYALPEIIERLDKISNRTKMHEMAYLFHDEANAAWAVPMNGPGELIHIGTDRINPGLHYLPFTDALRDYIEADDLPYIFEKPVGQICEILFGTDMQAVLGFKKAIRLLQEKNVDIGLIQSLDSYKAMDQALKERNLPPLSVVSTQNRPSLMRDELPAFRTMTLAEKLEELPSTITRLILQTQSSFRTIRQAKPHGLLSISDSVGILKEEINLYDATENHSIFIDRLYRLCRLYDRCYATLGNNLPAALQLYFQEIGLDVLEKLSIAFHDAEETLLARKMQSYIRDNRKSSETIDKHLYKINQSTAPLLNKIKRKKLLDEQTLILLETRFQQLHQQLDTALTTLT